MRASEIRGSFRRPIFLLGLAAAAALAGCMGPTKTGIEARKAARERVDIVNAQLHYDQAHQAWETGQFEKALSQINLAIGRYADAPPYHVLKGRIYLETHQLELALKSFEAALELDEGFADAHYFAGIVYERWSDDKAAYDHYRSAYELDNTSVRYLLPAAETLIATGDLEAAREMVESKLEYFEHNGALRHLLGQIALLEGDADRAVDMYTQARLLNPDDDFLLEDLAWAQYAAGLFSKSHGSVKQLQGRSRGNADRTDLKLLEARCLAMMGRSREARNLYLELTRSNASDPQGWIALGTLAWEMGDYQRVALCGARVVALVPHQYEGYMLTAINEREEGRLNEAATLLLEAAKRAQDTAIPHLLLGKTLEELGNRDGAFAAYAEAVRVDPESPEAQAMLNEFYESARLSAADEP
jgi:tetratricopeptide (TPR) repeat protein